MQCVLITYFVIFSKIHSTLCCLYYHAMTVEIHATQNANKHPISDHFYFFSRKKTSNQHKRQHMYSKLGQNFFYLCGISIVVVLILYFYLSCYTWIQFLGWTKPEIISFWTHKNQNHIKWFLTNFSDRSPILTWVTWDNCPKADEWCWWILKMTFWITDACL